MLLISLIKPQNNNKKKKKKRRRRKEEEKKKRISADEIAAYHSRETALHIAHLPPLGAEIFNPGCPLVDFYLTFGRPMDYQNYICHTMACAHTLCLQTNVHVWMAQSTKWKSLNNIPLFTVQGTVQLCCISQSSTGEGHCSSHRPVAL